MKVWMIFSSPVCIFETHLFCSWIVGVFLFQSLNLFDWSWSHLYIHIHDIPPRVRILIKLDADIHLLAGVTSRFCCFHSWSSSPSLFKAIYKIVIKVCSLCFVYTYNRFLQNGFSLESLYIAIQPMWPPWWVILDIIYIYMANFLYTYKCNDA